MVSMRLEPEVDAKTGYKNGRLKGNISLDRRPDPGTKMSVSISVAGEKGAAVRKTWPVADTAVNFLMPVMNLRCWSAEMPVLYDVRVRVTDTLGHGLDSLMMQTAFRDMEMRDGRWYCNGRAIWIKGMEVSQYDTATIRRMKMYNVNAVHGGSGDNGVWRRLCDQYGLYVIDDTGLAYTACGLGGLKERWDSLRVHGDVSGLFVPSVFSPEVKYVYQPVASTFSKSGAGVGVRVSNDHAFRDLSNLSMEWQLLVNGVMVRHGVAALPAIAPQKSAVVNIPVVVQPGGEALLNVYYKQKKAGFVVAEEQVKVSEGMNDVVVRPAGELVFKDEGGSFGITSTVAGLDMQFNKQTGWLQHYVVGGRSLLNDSLGLSAGFWQKPWCDSGRNMTVWQNAGADARLQLFSTSTSNDFVIVRADFVMPEVGCQLHIHYTVNARGEMQVEDILEVDTTGQPGIDTTAHLTKPPLPRMGMQWNFPPGYDSVIYYGRGPQDNYADRHASAFLGVYRQTTADALPRTDVRWWKVTDKQGHGLQVTADNTFLMMNMAGKMPVSLHIDHRQMGLAGRGLPYGNYHYIYKVTPL